VGDCKDKRVLIVDDICDGGKTFELLAKDLYNAGAEEVNLFVTHGLFSKGLIPLKLAGIKRIFTNKGQAIIMHDSGVGFRKIETSPYNNPYWDDRR
jgi:phosphoribosylpyrophosphate synthetase